MVYKGSAAKKQSKSKSKAKSKSKTRKSSPPPQPAAEALADTAMQAHLVFEAESRLPVFDSVLVAGTTVYTLGDDVITVSKDLRKRTVRKRLPVSLHGLWSDGRRWLAGGHGAIYSSEDSGKTWLMSDVPTDQVIGAVAALDGKVWAAGLGGFLGLEEVEGYGVVERPDAPPFKGCAFGRSLPYPRVAISRLAMADGQLYALGQGVWRLASDRAELELASEQLLVDICRTGEGTILVCGVDGALYRRPRGGTFERLAGDAIDPRGDRTYVGLVALERGVLLVGTEGDGALRWSTDDGRSFRPLPSIDIAGAPLGDYCQRNRLHRAVADGHGGALIVGWSGLMLRVAEDGLGPWASTSPAKKLATTTKRVTKKKPAVAKARRATSPPAGERDPQREAELLAAVRAEPDHDAPRMVYADWLDEHGAARGQFIQLQCQLRHVIWLAAGRTTQVARWGVEGYTRTPAIPDNLSNQVQLQQREVALYKKHHKAWMAPLRAYVRKWSWRRGFIDTIDSGPRFLPGAAEVFAAHPLEELTLEGMSPEELDALAEVPLPGLRCLRLPCQRMTHHQLRCVLSPTVANLHGLDLSENPFGTEGALALAERSPSTQLRWLRVRGCQIGDEGLLALGTSPALQGLESLDIGGCDDNELTTEGIVTFVERCNLERLRLVFWGRITPKAKQAITARFE